MSIRTVKFKRKIAQAKRVGVTDFSNLTHFDQAKSTGRRTVFGQVDSLDEDGNPQKAGKRYPGRASDKVGTVSPNPDTLARFMRLAK